MTCKIHPHEPGVGVCASCLRERLFALIAAQNKLAGDPNTSPHNPHLSFPRSVSPYFSRRGSLRPGPPAVNSFDTPLAGTLSRRKPYSLWSSFLRYSRSESSDPRSSFSWISALIRRKKSRKLFEAVGSSQPLDREGDAVTDEGYSSDSSGAGRLPGPTPVRPTAARTAAGGRGFSGYTVCLSPLVRLNPNPRRDKEVNDQIRRHVSLGDDRSVGANRSRKLTDFGRAK